MNENISDKVFTEIDNKVNASLNNLEVNCITNTNNKFSLDSDGNLFVNSITSNTNNNFNIDNIYPVGSIYFNITNINPSTYFGGVWEQFAQGKTIIGVDENDSDFNNTLKSGGEKSHTLTTAEMPSHTHNIWGGYTSTKNGRVGASYAENGWIPLNGINKEYNIAALTFNGSSESHNNMPPYITCYIWKRIS